MTPDFIEGGWYFIHVDQETLSVYVSWTLSNDVVGTDDDFEDVYELWNDKLVRFTHPVASGSCSGGCSGGCAGNSASAFTDHPISISIDGVKYYYLYDGLGSVTELIDESENVVNVYRYMPFGDALVRLETVYNPYQFTGRQYDAESGLYHYRARAYSPDIGRFMQQDPAGMVDGPNMYAYVGWNPVNRVDPSGMGWWCSFSCSIAWALFSLLVSALIIVYVVASGAPPGYNVVVSVSIAAIIGSGGTVYCYNKCKGSSASALISLVLSPLIASLCGLVTILWPPAGLMCTLSAMVILAVAKAALPGV